MNQEEKPDYKDLVKSFQEDCNCYETDNSNVSKFFAGKYIFITGGTGFLGKLIIEKLLRTCPEISGIFMLVRPKKGKDIHTRVDELLNDEVFERLGKRHPKFRYKIIPVSGDVGLPGLGLRIEDRKVIVDKVSVVFHGAATLRFDEKLNIANTINVKGTEEAVLLAKECHRLVSFVHVSTAYSNCPNKEIKEIFYESPIAPETLTQICDSLTPEMLEKITPDLIAGWPNSYTYTKAVAEDVVRRQGRNMPISVFRPAIVISTYKEPLKSWIDNIYGPTGYCLGVGIGLIRTLPANTNAIADIVPADMVVSGIIAACYQNAVAKADSIQIYNYVSSVQRPLTWAHYCDYSKRFGTILGSTKSIWYYSLLMINNRALYLLYAFLVHTIPALLVDIVTVLILRKPQMLKIYGKIHKFSTVLSYFATRKWKISNDNVQNLYKTLSPEDKKIFNFDMEQFDWIEYMKVYCLGVRVYIMKDPISTMESGRKKYARLRVMHYSLLTILFVLGINILYKLLSYVYQTIF